ncbi:hypothetical protein HSB1_14660 [Halogranum salarium B-1]|uniref:Uncharacterized protein n=1 Tax=Halogranum salarium B-1 TaxID=1210908 RepID=J3A5V8_9EURY|nr:hypothetical protein HSB1_14660 [Halogranum salarium B-1]
MAKRLSERAPRSSSSERRGSSECSGSSERRYPTMMWSLWRA